MAAACRDDFRERVSAMRNAAYVAAVGQVQMVFTMAMSWLYFRERILPLELLGIAVIVTGVLLFRS